jgi:hypothetical protein
MSCEIRLRLYSRILCNDVQCDPKKMALHVHDGLLDPKIYGEFQADVFHKILSVVWYEKCGNQ